MSLQAAFPSLNACFGHAHPVAQASIVFRVTPLNVAIVSSVISKWRLNTSPMFHGALFVIPVIIHNSSRKVYRTFLLQLQCQGLWVSTYLPYALDKSPHTAILPNNMNIKENWIL